jgi:hypothetical protein
MATFLALFGMEIPRLTADSANADELVFIHFTDILKEMNQAPKKFDSRGVILIV